MKKFFRSLFHYYVLGIFVALTFAWYFLFWILSFNSDWGHKMYVSFCKDVIEENGVKW